MSAHPLIELPNGLEVAFQTRSEARFFYEDIFEKEAYVRHGIALEDGAVVFDVGANIGMFTLFVHTWCRQPRVYSFEPVPVLFEILWFNAGRHAPGARLFNVGLSDRARRERFTFYPNSSGMSSVYADEEEEKEVLRAILANQHRQGAEGLDEVLLHVDDLLEERLRRVEVEVELRTVSDIIREEGVDRIDLMKIDVQKSECDVLAGIEDEHWPLIRQMVLEVHDFAGRVRQVLEELRGRGYEVLAEQDDFYTESNIYNLYARRPPAPAREDRYQRIQDRAASLRQSLLRQKQRRGAAK
jgi:FkbM family methyltransferase